MPLFSVIVPVYNAEKYLSQCVESILSQTCGDFELILVDDGSPDGSPALCDAYAAKDGRVAVIHQKNAGPTPARKAGLDRASGKYVCFADADDWVEARWLEVLKGHIDACHEPDVVVCDIARDTGKTEQPVYADEGYYDKARLEKEIYPYMVIDARRAPFGTQLLPGFLYTKAWKRELIAEHYLSDGRITLYEDTAMTYECLWFANDVYISREKLYIYRRVENSNLRHYRPRFFLEIRWFLDYANSHLAPLSPLFPAQINAFTVHNGLIRGLSMEVLYGGTGLTAAAKRVAAAMKETGLARDLALDGLPGYIKLYVLLVKCRLYLPALWVTKMRLRAAGK